MMGNSQAVNWHRYRKAQLVAYKGGRCYDCGQVFPQCCFDFDHRNPKNKCFNIGEQGARGTPLPELMVEADKCDLVCANCHRIRTYGNPDISEKISAGLRGKSPWNKGKRCPNISAKMMGNTNGKGCRGRSLTPEHRAALSKSLRERGIQPSPEARQKAAAINIKRKEGRS